MGWRTDDAYERQQETDLRKWRASLSWREYAAWQWDRHRHFLAGAAAAAVILSGIWWLFGE